MRPAPPTLVFTPPFDDTPRGVFATRAPTRPNPIGLAVVAFDGFAAPNRLAVRYLDCLDGTPLLDIKPYLRTTDAEPAATLGWLTPHAGPRLGPRQRRQGPPDRGDRSRCAPRRWPWSR